jgi:UrcA family protein
VAHVRFNFRTPRALAACLVALAGCVFVATADAAGVVTANSGVPSVVVRYNDLNLASDQGAQALYRRLSGAARRVCPVENARDLGEFSRSRGCQTEAIARAVQEINNPRLAALHALHSSRS